MKLKAVSFGEILWDKFPNYKVIGGAPLNLILRMKSLGHDCNIISNVGNDKNGNDILKYLSINKISIDTISVSRKSSYVHKSNVYTMVILEKIPSPEVTVISVLKILILKWGIKKQDTL